MVTTGEDAGGEASSSDVAEGVLLAVVVEPGSAPRVHVHSRTRFRRPATGVSGHLSLSDSSDESRLSPVCGPFSFSLVLLLLCWPHLRGNCGLSFGIASPELLDDSEVRVVVDEVGYKEEGRVGSECELKWPPVVGARVGAVKVVVDEAGSKEEGKVGSECELKWLDASHAKGSRT